MAYLEESIRVDFSGEVGGVLTEGEAEAILLSDGTRLLRVRYRSPRALCDVSCSARMDRTCGLTAARVEAEGIEIEVEEEIAEALLAPILCLFREGAREAERSDGGCVVEWEDGAILRLTEGEDGKLRPREYRSAGGHLRWTYPPPAGCGLVSFAQKLAKRRSLVDLYIDNTLYL